MRVTSMREGSTTQAALRAWPLFVAMALIMMGNGLQSTVIGVRATLEGFPTTVTGLVMSGYYIGFLASSAMSPKMLWQVGHVRVYAGLASLASTATLAHLIVINPWAWMIFRMITGFCLAGLYIVAESWLNGASTNENRGRLLSIYMLVFSVATAASQGLLSVADIGGFKLFVFASVLVSLAVVPISLTPTSAPNFEEPSGVPIRALFKAAPLGMSGALITGLTNGALVAAGPVYGTEVGMSVARIGLFIALGLIGQLLFQWPLGAISDRVSRRKVLLAVTTFAALAAGFAITLDPLGPQLMAVAFVYGGLSYSMYSLSISHVNDVVASDKLVAASAAMVMAGGIGAIIGPLAGTGAIELIGPRGFWLVLVVFNGSLAVFATYRVTLFRQIDINEKRHFKMVPSRSTSMALRLMRDRRR